MRSSFNLIELEFLVIVVIFKFNNIRNASFNFALILMIKNTIVSIEDQIQIKRIEISFKIIE